VIEESFTSPIAPNPAPNSPQPDFASFAGFRSRSLALCNKEWESLIAEGKLSRVAMGALLMKKRGGVACYR